MNCEAKDADAVGAVTLTTLRLNATGANRDPGFCPYIMATPRKDGKFTTVYCFEFRRITKIRTREQINEEAATGRFLIRGI